MEEDAGMNLRPEILLRISVPVERDQGTEEEKREKKCRFKPCKSVSSPDLLTRPIRCDMFRLLCLHITDFDVNKKTFPEACSGRICRIYPCADSFQPANDSNGQ